MAAAGVIGIGIYFARKKWGGKRNKNERDEKVEEKRELPGEPNSRSGGTKGARYRTYPRGNDDLDRDHLPPPRPGTLDNEGELDMEDGYGPSQDSTPGMNGEGRAPFDEAYSQGPGSPGAGDFDDRGHDGAEDDQTDDR
jgi:hypothetical protein